MCCGKWKYLWVTLTLPAETRCQTTASSGHKLVKDAKKSDSIDFESEEKCGTVGNQKNSMFSMSKMSLKYYMITVLSDCPKVEQNAKCQNKSNLYPVTRERFKEMVYFEGKCVHIHTLFGMTKQQSIVLLYAVRRSFKSPFQSSWCHLNSSQKMYFSECH